MKKTLLVLLAILLAVTVATALVACNQDPCKNGHSWDEGEITTPSTCTVEGVRLQRCKICGTTREVSVAKAAHEWGEPEVTQEPTCVLPGRGTVKCKNCTETQTDYLIPATGVHEIDESTKHEAVPATCYATGRVEFYQCKTCDVYLDKDGNVLQDVVTPKTPHTYDSGVVTREPTCTETGTRKFTCQNDGCGEYYTEEITAKGHDYGRLIPEQPADCLTSGREAHYQCRFCHKYFDVNLAEKEWEDLRVEPLGHKYELVKGKPATCTEDGIEDYYKCSRCQNIFNSDGNGNYTQLEQPITITATGHKEKEIPAVAATCTVGGKTKGVECSVCHKILVAPKNTAPLGHSWGNWYTVKEPTCTETGVQHRDCLVCKTTDTETQPIPAKGHDFVYTSNNDGIHHTVTCKRDCGYSEQEECASTGDWMSDIAEYHYHKCDKCQGECDITNHTFEDKKCTVCGATQSEVIVRVEGELDHTELSVADAIKYIKDNYNDGEKHATIIIGAIRNATADVTFDGNINVTLDMGNFGINMRTFSLIVDEQANVTLTNGALTGKVQFNGGTLALNKVSGNYTIALDKGLTCDKVNVTIDGKQLEHTWGEWYTAKEPTCTETGVQHRDCKVCGKTDTETKSIPQKDHTYKFVEWTWDEVDFKTATAHFNCSECGGDEHTVVVDLTENSRIPATCVDKGEVVYKPVKEAVFEGVTAPDHEFKKELAIDSDNHDLVCEKLAEKDGYHTIKCSREKCDYSYEEKCTSDLDENKWHTDETNHWYECTKCKDVYNLSTHDWDYTKGTTPGEHTRTCKNCQYSEQAACEPLAGVGQDAGGHHVKDNWYANADSHWQKCQYCKENFNIGKHNSDGTDFACSVCEHPHFGVNVFVGDSATVGYYAPSVADAMQWIGDQTDKTVTYKIDVGEGRTGDGFTVPAGYKVQINLEKHTLTFDHSNATHAIVVPQGSSLTITNGNVERPADADIPSLFDVTGTLVLTDVTLTANGKTEFALNSGANLTLPSGTYAITYREGATCDNTTVTIGGTKRTHNAGKYEHDANAWTHHQLCTYCGSKVKTNMACTPDGNQDNKCKDCKFEYTPEIFMPKFRALNSGNELPGTYKVTGIVTEVKQTGQYNGKWEIRFCMDVTYGDGEVYNLLCYWAFGSSQEQVESIKLGYKVTVVGGLVNYKDTLQMDQGANITNIEIPNYSVTFKYPNADDESKVAVAGDTSAKVGEKVSFKIEVKPDFVGWFIKYVKVGDELLTPDGEGYYEFNIIRDTDVVITLINEAEEPFEESSITYKSSDKGQENGTDLTSDFKDPISFFFDGGKYYDKNSAVRVYAGSTFTVSAPQGYTITKIVIKYYADKVENTITADTDSLSKPTGTQNPYTITWTGAAESVKFTVGGVGGHVRLEQIDVSYLPVCHHLERTKTEKNDPTCTEDGNKEYWTCNRCGAVFESEQSSQAKKKSDFVDLATGHSYTKYEWKWNEDCTSATITFTCEKCDSNEKDHTKSYTVTTESGITSKVAQVQSCTNPEMTTYTATVTVEGKEYAQTTYTSTNELQTKAAAGHTFVYTHKATDPDGKHTVSCSYGDLEEYQQDCDKKVLYNTAQHYYHCDLCTNDYGYDDHVWDPDTGECTFEGCTASNFCVTVFVDGEDHSCTSLAKAFEFVKSGSEATITLNDDINETMLELPAEGTVTINLNGKKLVVKEEINFVAGHVTIVGVNFEVTINVMSANAELHLAKETTGYTLKLQGVTCDNSKVFIDEKQLTHSYVFASDEQKGHHTVCKLCSDATSIVAHNFSYSNTDGTQHTATCNDCDYTETVDHKFTSYVDNGAKYTHTHECACGKSEEISYKNNLQEHNAEGHTVDCDKCEFSKTETHEEIAKTLTGEDDWTSYGKEDLYHHKANCPVCDQVIMQEHDFSDKNGDGKNDDCKCGEPICGDKSVLLNISSLGIGESYGDGSKEIGGITFAFTELGDYGHGMSTRDKKSEIHNTTAINGKIIQIKIGWNTQTNKTGTLFHLYLNDLCTFEGVTAINIDRSDGSSETTYNIPDGKTYTYFKLIHDHKNTIYVDFVEVHYITDTHVVEDWDPYEPQCLTDTVRTGKCVRCGETVTEKVDKIGHDWERVDAEDATCEHPAYVQQWHCKRCDKYYDNRSDSKPDEYTPDAGLSSDKIVDGTKNEGKPVAHQVEWTHQIVEGKHQHTGECSACKQTITEDCTLTDVDEVEETHKLHCDICGWTADASEPHNSDGEGGKCTCGYANGKVYYQVGDSTDKQYATLQEAINNLGSEKEIKLLADVTENITAAITKNFTLNLGSYTLTLGNGITLNGEVTISGSILDGKRGTIKAAAGVSTALITANNLCLENVIVDASNVSGDAIKIDGSINLSGSAVIANSGHSALRFVVKATNTMAEVEETTFSEGVDTNVKGKITFAFDAVPTKTNISFDKELTEYNVVFEPGETGVTCDTFFGKEGLTFKFNNKQIISHSYLNGTGPCTVCGEEKEVKWTKLANVTDLKVGDQLIFANGTTAMGSQNTSGSNPYRNQILNGITLSDDQTTIEKVDKIAAIITLEKGSIDNTYALHVSDGYLSWSSGNSVTITDSINPNSSWLFTVENNAIAIKNGSDNTRELKYNKSATRFACYTSGQSYCDIWVYAGGGYEIEGGDEGGGEVEQPLTIIKFGSLGDREGAGTDEETVYKKDGFTFTSLKGTSTSKNRNTDSDHYRIYKNSTFQITGDTAFTKLVFTCTSDSYATVLQQSIGENASVSGTTVTITFAEATTSTAIYTASNQTRLTTLEIWV